MYRIMYKYVNGRRKAQSAVVYDEKLDALVEARFATAAEAEQKAIKWFGSSIPEVEYYVEYIKKK